MTPYGTLYIHFDRPGGAACRLEEIDEPLVTAEPLPLTSGDVIALRIYFSTWRSGSYASAELDGNYEPVVTLCAESALVGTPTELVRLAGLTQTQDEVLDAYVWTGYLDLSGQPIQTALGAAASFSAVLDLRVQDNSGHVHTYRVAATVRRSASGVVATPGETGVAIANLSNSQMRQRADGRIEFYDMVRAKWLEPYLANGVLSWLEN
jgi:hypothetical protein